MSKNTPSNENKKIQESFDKLKRFLNENDRRVKKGEPFTHGSMEPSGSYFIKEDKDVVMFQTLYNNCCANKINKKEGKNFSLTFTEKPEKYTPLRFDFDFKASLDHPERQYDYILIKRIIEIIQTEIKRIVNPLEFKKNITWCLLLEKPLRSDEGKIKDGVHLHFPHFITEVWVSSYLYNQVENRINDDMLFSGKHFLEPDNILDKGVNRCNWMMYGSSKAEKLQPFLVTKCYDDNLDEITLDKVFEEDMVGRKLSVKYYLPTFLSIRGYNDDLATPLLESFVDLREKLQKKKIKNSVSGTRTAEQVAADLRLIKEGDIMSMLKDERAEDYHMWMDVGWTLFNVGQGNDESLQMWIEFSQRSAQFVDGKCEELWYKMKLRDKTIGSLLAMAKSDNPLRYKEWKMFNVDKLIYDALHTTKDGKYKPNEYKVALVIKCLYSDKFICINSKQNIWYEFKNHRWFKLDNGIELEKLFSTEVVDFLDLYREKRCNQQRNLDKTSAEYKALEEEIKRVSSLKLSLWECAFQGKLMAMCKKEFHQPSYYDKFNTNKLLWCCDNGVIDLENMLFREGRPDDYITMSCRKNYRKFSYDDDEVKDLQYQLRKIYVDDSIRNYALDLFASCLEGGNINKIFAIHTGRGDNGKSIIFKLIEKTGGDYVFKYSQGVLTNKNVQSSGPRSDLMKSKNKRIAVVDELTPKDTINVGVLKLITGSDTMPARGMYKEDEEDLETTATLHLPCNDKPKIDARDAAVWNRNRIIDYQSVFIKPEDVKKKGPIPATEAEQFKQKRFKADKNFADKLDEIAPVFLWLLFERYKVYKKTGLNEPDCVTNSTNQYREENDPYIQFISDKLEKTDNPEDKLKIADLKTEFSAWYSENYPGSTFGKVNIQIIRTEFSRSLGAPELKKKSEGLYWKGWKFATDEVDENQQRILEEVMKKKDNTN